SAGILALVLAMEPILRRSEKTPGVSVAVKRRGQHEVPPEDGRDRESGHAQEPAAQERAVGMMGAEETQAREDPPGSRPAAPDAPRDDGRDPEDEADEKEPSPKAPRQLERREEVRLQEHDQPEDAVDGDDEQEAQGEAGPEAAKIFDSVPA